MLDAGAVHLEINRTVAGIDDIAGAAAGLTARLAVIQFCPPLGKVDPCCFGAVREIDIDKLGGSAGSAVKVCIECEDMRAALDDGGGIMEFFLVLRKNPFEESLVAP
jgi:hypothetical protein